MRLRSVLLSVLGMVVLLSLAAAGQETKSTRQAASSRGSDEAAIRALSADWTKAINAKDVEKTISFYAEDASVFPPSMPVATSADQRRQVWTQVLATPGLALNLTPTKIEVAKSRDLAFETGSFELTATDKDGKSAASKGKYVVVWEKKAGGTWKAAADIWNLDQ